ncbi:MAG: hypothetical protein P8J47_07880, partial [Bacteroidales bacterium]|nr:hypothetical protein [Bacteroidales bacterium]
MRIVSVSEDQKIEKRIAITPEIAKKYVTLGFEVSLPENYGEHLGFTDDKYKELAKDARLAPDDLQSKLDTKKQKRNQKKEAV